MAITNWQDPQTSEIRSTHISGLMDAVGKLEESIGMDTVAEENIPLTEVYISAEDRYRIFQAPAGKRNWLASPAPVIKKNGVVIESDYVIDYGGGAIALSVNDTEENTYTADATYVTPLNTSFKSHKAETAKVYISVTNPPSPMVAAKGDGVTDDTTAIQSVVDYIHTQFGSGVVIFPYTEDYYKVSGKIKLYSNVSLVGSKAYIYNDTESAEPVFEIVGTAANRLSNIKIKGLKIRNGTASEGAYTVGKDGIEVKYCDGFKLKDCEITEIQGVHGLSTRYSTDIWVHRNKFYRCTYTCFGVLPECENVHVYGNTFDTVTSLTTPNTYLFATGGDATIDNFACKNVWVKDNRFLNNPRWEAIDSHGCENMWIEDNYAINCKNGIMVAGDGTFAVNARAKNIHIENNVLIQGTGEVGSPGIYVGSSVSQPIENVTIRGNETVGFGSTTAGAIMFQAILGGEVTENTLRDYRHIGICPGGGNINVNVHHNHFKDNASDAIGTAIYVLNYGNIRIAIDHNDSYPSSVAVSPQYFIRNQNARYNNVTAKNNVYIGNTIKYAGRICSGFNPNDNISATALFYMCKGDILYDINEVPLYVVTSPEKGHAGNRALVHHVFSGELGSNILTLDTYVKGATADYGLGCNITIPLASDSMNAIITKIGDDYIEIDQNLPEDIVSQEIYNAVATWSRTQMTDIQGSTTWNPGSLADGAGETSAAITVTGAAFGDYVLVAAPYDLQGITCNGYVSAANTVKIRLQNETGGVIDLASGTWKVKVIKA